MGGQIPFLQLGLIALFIVLPVQEAVLFIAQVRRQETITAAAAVVAVVTLSAVVDQHAVLATVAVLDIHTFVASFRFLIYCRAIGYVGAVKYKIRIQGILTMHRRRAHETILVVRGMSGIFGIHTVFPK